MLEKPDYLLWSHKVVFHIIMLVFMLITDIIVCSKLS